MTTNSTKHSEAWDLALQLAGRYGRLALSRAAGEAAYAARKGDSERYALWGSVVATLREAMLQQAASATA